MSKDCIQTKLEMNKKESYLNEEEEEFHVM